MNKVRIGDVIYTGPRNSAGGLSDDPQHWLAVKAFWMNAYVCEDKGGVICLVKRKNVLLDSNAGCFIALGKWAEEPGSYLRYLEETQNSKFSAESCLHEIYRWLKSDLGLYLATPAEIRELVETWYDQHTGAKA